MAAEPTFSQNLDSRNRGGTEPKRKLWKKRSIRLSRGSYLRQSSKSSKSRFDWLPVDESRGTSSRQQPSLVAFSDSSPNYVKVTSSSNAKKESSQEGSEHEDVNSVVSSSCGWSDRAVYPSVTMSDDAAVPRNQCSSEDASPLSLKATRYQPSHHESESSYDSSDHSKSPHYTPSKTIYSGQKSLQVLTRSSSRKAVKVLFKKSSFKPKRTPRKHSHISEDLSVERATCSSTIKDSRFPEHVELEPGQTESERTSFVKVCPYHHCSLNGHCHEPEPPIPKKPFLRRKSQSSIPQRSVRKSSGAGPGKKGSGEKKKGAKKQPRAQFLQGASATVEDSNLIEIALSGTSHPEEGNQKSLEELRNSSTLEEDVAETYFGLKERSFGSYQERKEEDKCDPLALGVVSEGHESTTSNGSREHISVTLDGDNDNFSRIPLLKYSSMRHDQVSISGDCDSDSKSSENNPSCNITRNVWSSKINEAMEETSSNQQQTRVVVSESTPAGDSENKEQVSTRDSEPAVPSGVHKAQTGKGRKMSMWHLIHKHMVSGLDEDGGARPLQGADEERKEKEADMGTARKSSDVGPDFSNSDAGTSNQDDENQDTEIRKLYAIKLVREAIEKILLPEVQDQVSENQSVTSDIVEDPEPSEKNQQEGPNEGCHTESHNISDSDNMPADPVARVEVDDSTRQEETKKSEAKLGKKSDKKSPSNWSNLKKWILLQRFTKELEKVRKLNLRKPRQVQFETDAGAEKLSLRRQTAEEKKRAEEWMLDYAMQQVVSQLAPTQKRKVSLLVKAFETVVPPQEERGIQARDSSGKSSDHVEHFETSNHQLPGVDDADFSTDTSWKSDNLKSSTSKDVPLDESQRDIKVEEFSSLKSEVFAGGFEVKNKIEKKDDLSGVAGDQSYSIQSKTCDVDRESIATGNILPASDENAAANFRAPEPDNNTNAEPGNVDLQGIHNDTTIRQNSLVLQKFPPLGSMSNYKANEAGQSQLDKENYLSMWHSVCQHVVSSVANKVGMELLGEEDEEAGDASKFSGIESAASRKDTPKGSLGMAKKIDVAIHHQAEFSRSQVLQLVKEAIQEILSPEIQDDSSDTLSVSSEIIPDKELSDKDNGEGAKQSSTGLTEQNAREIDRSEEGISLDGGKKSNNNDTTEEDSKIAESLEKSKSDPPKTKNWSKLKKLMLLKRSIKAMEKARNLKLKPPQQLPLPSDVEPEKVDLRHQMVDERRKAEQWMLDYAVQHIVTKLTPARKKRVAMLVEAFEAVVPLPDM